MTARMGLEPEGSFLAVGFVPVAEAHELERLRMRLHLNAAGVLAASYQSTFVVLQQEDRTDVVQRLCRPYALGGVLGTGERRDGLSGARLSVGDAQRAVELAIRLGHDVDFGEHWPMASLMASPSHLDRLDVGIAVATANPHLGETIVAFADDGFSAAATARAQHLHPNSVAYRLERWTHLTGLEGNRVRRTGPFGGGHSAVGRNRSLATAVGPDTSTLPPDRGRSKAVDTIRVIARASQPSAWQRSAEPCRPSAQAFRGAVHRRHTNV